MGSNRRRDTGRGPPPTPVHFWPGPGKYWRWPGAELLCRTQGTALASTGDRQRVTCCRCRRRLSELPTALLAGPSPWSSAELVRHGFTPAGSSPLPVTPVELRPRLPVPAQPSPLLSMAARWRGQAAQLYARRATTPGAVLAAMVVNSAAAELEDLVEQIRKGAA